MTTFLRGARAALLAGALVLAGAPSALRAQDDVGIAVGATAPGAEVQTLDGKTVNLSQYIGKEPVLLEFWAVWCGNCKHLEPQMNALAKKYGSKMKFVGVAVSVNQSPERIKRYAEKYGLPQKIFYDDAGHAVEAYDAPATSYIVVIDKAGKVVYTGLGPEQDLEAAVKKAI